MIHSGCNQFTLSNQFFVSRQQLRRRQMRSLTRYMKATAQQSWNLLSQLSFNLSKINLSILEIESQQMRIRSARKPRLGAESWSVNFNNLKPMSASNGIFFLIANGGWMESVQAQCCSKQKPRHGREREIKWEKNWKRISNLRWMF